MTYSLIVYNIEKWIDLINPEQGAGGLVNTEHFISFLHKSIKQATYQELRIPLQVVATDYWPGE